MSAGTLFIVSTPIGNLGDITYRAVEILRGVSAILAEDTRHSHRLLSRYEIATSVLSLHEHNEREMIPRVIDRLTAGESLALISDAGTPLVSDPGARLIDAAVAAGVTIAPVPGASAVLAALVGSDLFAGEFTFIGFLPRKGSDRQERLQRIASSSHPIVLYESPQRLAATLSELVLIAGGHRRAVVARELTKLHEEFRRGTLAELAEYYESSTPRGEIVVIVEGAEPATADQDMLKSLSVELRQAGQSPREIARTLIERGASRNLAYRLAHGTDRQPLDEETGSRVDE